MFDGIWYPYGNGMSVIGESVVNQKPNVFAYRLNCQFFDSANQWLHYIVLINFTFR